jgi:hypothetical protein
MLAQAQHLQNLPCVQGDAQSLPFGTAQFDLVVLITTLEFVADPAQSVAEAARVAKMGLLLGVLNRWSRLGLKLALLRREPWASAHLFPPRELQRFVKKALGGRVQDWRWALALAPSRHAGRFSLAFAGFVGAAIHLRRIPGHPADDQ